MKKKITDNIAIPIWEPKKYTIGNQFLCLIFGHSPKKEEAVIENHQLIKPYAKYCYVCGINMKKRIIIRG